MLKVSMWLNTGALSCGSFHLHISLAYILSMGYGLGFQKEKNYLLNWILVYNYVILSIDSTFLLYSIVASDFLNCKSIGCYQYCIKFVIEKSCITSFAF
jgi:hypothetical protein